MKYSGDESNSKGKRSRKYIGRIGVLVVLIVAGVVLLQYRSNISSSITKVFASADEETVPVVKLARQPFSLTVTSTGEIVGLDSTPVPTPSTSSGSLTISWLIPEGSFVKAGDPVVRFDNTDAKLTLEKQQNALNSNQENTKITTWSQGTNEKVMSLDQESAEKEYEYAKTVMPQDETIFSKWDIITAQADIRYNKENVDFLKSKGKTQKRIARSEQQILSIERNKAQSQISISKRTLESLELTAPVGGLVLYRRDHREDPQIGDNSYPGQVIVEIINLDVLQAQINVLERDGGNLEKGQPVVIKLDAVPDKQYHGVIRTVSSVATALERNSPLKYFTCDVSILDAGHDLKLIRPGMNLRGDVILQKYDSCFVVPSGAVTVKENQTDNIVYVKKNNRFEPRVVQTGLSSHGEAVILGGVQEGELIALADPNGTRKLHVPDFNKGSQDSGFPGGGMMPPPGRMMMGGGPR